MKIQQLAQDIPSLVVHGVCDTEITGISSNSQAVAPGNIFVAKRGRSHDGSRFIANAIEAGACAIVCDTYNPSLSITQLVHPDVATAEAILADRLYDSPSSKLFMVGITGTNGKTTTATLIKHLLEPCGLIGTIEYVIGSKRYPATHTTPDLCRNQKMLAEMLQEGCQAAVMEVTSHALDQGRVNNIRFDAAVYTNLTAEHLDYHVTMEAYAAAKKRLFDSQPSVAIVNKDCPWHARLLENYRGPVLTYGLQDANLTPKNVELSADGSRFTLSYKKETAIFHIPIPGRFNLYNALAAIAVGLTNGITLQHIALSLAAFKSVPGRLEPVPNELGISVYVDFAHTHDALENTLTCLQELKKGRIITVFGCGGDRDRGKRPLMAKVSEKWSDFTIVTSDNPRTEDPQSICQEIVSGFKRRESYEVQVDRKSAILKAIQLAQPNDIVLIAGKGHEGQQIFATHTIPFSDSAIAHELCKIGLK